MSAYNPETDADFLSQSQKIEKSSPANASATENSQNNIAGERGQRHSAAGQLLWSKLRNYTLTDKDKAQLHQDIEKEMEKQHVEFVVNQAELSAEGKQALDKIIPYLLTHPAAVIGIEGHTNCKDPTTIPQRKNSVGNLIALKVKPCTADYCRLLKLSQSRVDAVKAYLTKWGCNNEFVAQGWGCRHDEHGGVRTVRIFPL